MRERAAKLGRAVHRVRPFLVLRGVQQRPQLTQVARGVVAADEAAVRGQHPRQLADRPRPVGHVVEHPVGDGDVERPVGERQLLDVCQDGAQPPRAGCSHRGRRAVDAGDLRRRDQRGEVAAAAARLADPGRALLGDRCECQEPRLVASGEPAGAVETAHLQPLHRRVLVGNKPLVSEVGHPSEAIAHTPGLPCAVWCDGSPEEVPHTGFEPVLPP